MIVVYHAVEQYGEFAYRCVLGCKGLKTWYCCFRNMLPLRHSQRGLSVQHVPNVLFTIRYRL